MNDQIPVYTFPKLDFSHSANIFPPLPHPKPLESIKVRNIVSIRLNSCVNNLVGISYLFRFHFFCVRFMFTHLSIRNFRSRSVEGENLNFISKANKDKL